MNTEADRRGNAAEKTGNTRGGDNSHKTVMFGISGSGDELPGSPSASVLFWQPRADECQDGCKRHCHGYQPCHGNCYFLRPTSTSTAGKERE